MSRQVFSFVALLLLLAGVAVADRVAEVLDTFAIVADSLTGDFPDEAMSPFDQSMPGYEKLRTNFFGVTECCHVSCSVKILSEEGDKNESSVSLDWTVTIRNKNMAAMVETRRKTVAAKLKRNGKKWKIVSFDGVDLFDPILRTRQ